MGEARTYLITGGCGFIGSHLAEAVIASGHKARILDDLSTGKLENAPKGAEVIVGDICDPQALERAMKGVAGVYHLAAIASVQKCVHEWRASTEVNLLGSVAVMEAAAKRRLPFVYASSAAIYGDAPAPVAVTAQARPLSAYGVDKYAMELHAAAAAITQGGRGFGVRFFNIYGPRQDPNSPYSGVIAIFLKRLMAREPLTIFGDGRQTRDFVYVSDAVRACMAGMVSLELDSSPRSHVENVCHGRGVTLLELANVLGEALRVTVNIAHEPARAGDIRQSWGEPSQLLRALGAAPRVSLADGLARLAAAERSEAREEA